MENTERISHKQLFNPKWYWEQTKGWSKTSYLLLAFGYIVITATNFLTFTRGIGIAPSPNLWIWLAAILGFTTTLAITNAKPMNGVLGLISALIYIGVAIAAHNPADAATQVFYIVVLDVPVLAMPSWSRNVENRLRFIHETGKRGEKHGPAFWYTTLAVIGVAAFIAAYLFETLVLHTPRPAADSFVLGTGMVGAILTTLRFGESGLMWVIQGIAQVILWGLTAMHGDANWVLFVTYLMYVLNDFIIVFQSKWFHHKEITDQLVAAHMQHN